MASSEEERLINEVDELESQLSHAGYPINPDLSKFFYRSLENKSTAAERVPKWSQRATYLKQRLEGASAGAAVSPVDAHHDLQQTEAVHIGLKRKELPEPEPVIDSCMRALKKEKKNGYRVTIDGSPPRMKSNHVEFIQFCVDELKKDTTITQTMLVHNFQTAHPGDDTKFAESVFPNNFITSNQLRRISRGELPLPIALPKYTTTKKGKLCSQTTSGRSPQ